MVPLLVASFPVLLKFPILFITCLFAWAKILYHFQVDVCLFTIRRLFILIKPSSYKSPSKPTSSLGRHLLGALQAGRSRHEQSRETMAKVFFPESDIPIPGDQDPAFRTTSGGRDDRKDGGDTTHCEQEDRFIEYLSRYVLRRKVHAVPEIV